MSQSRPVPPPKQPVRPSDPRPAQAVQDSAPQSTQPDPTNVYEFAPQKDITAYEVAQLLMKMEMTCTHDAFMAMPLALRRHFTGRSRYAEAPRRPG